MILVNDIAENRYRIQSIFNRLLDVEDKRDMLDILKILHQEKLLSDEQFEKISEIEDVDLPAIATVAIELLRQSLHSLLAELEENGNAMIREKIAAVLEELWRRHAISASAYNSIKETL